ncbi:hypothetical protein KC352_g39 [Hortaea werneckii]|nr:hypothetical protein KC352_g39 [Hortaea werneckii]
MGMPLVSRRWTQDQREMDRVFDGVLQRRWPIWLVAYSEATRYTMQKRIETEEWCKVNDKRLGHHLLYPRTKGFVASTTRSSKSRLRLVRRSFSPDSATSGGSTCTLIVIR